MRTVWLLAVVGAIVTVAYLLIPVRNQSSSGRSLPWGVSEITQMLEHAGASVELVQPSDAAPTDSSTIELDVGEPVMLMFDTGSGLNTVRGAGDVYVYTSPAQLKKYWKVDKDGSAVPRYFYVTDVSWVAKDNVLFSMSGWALLPALGVVNEVRYEMSTGLR